MLFSDLPGHHSPVKALKPDFFVYYQLSCQVIVFKGICPWNANIACGLRCTTEKYATLASDLAHFYFCYSQLKCLHVAQ